MMRSFLYLLFPLTTTTIVATLSLAENLDEAGSGANEVQSTIYIPSTGNSDGNLLDDSAALVGIDNAIPGWGLGNEEAQANNENGDACSGFKPINRKRQRGKGENNYCPPTDAPAPAPHSQQEEGSEGAGAGGSSTTTTRTDQDSGSGSSSSQSGLQLGTEGVNLLKLAPWTSTQTSCPGNRPVALCAGAELQPYGLSPGWQSIPFSDLPPPPEELFYWPYCRLWTYNAPCKTELKLELFMCCEYIIKNVPGGRDTGFEMRKRRYMTLEYPFNGHSCIAAVEPRTRL